MNANLPLILGFNLNEEQTAAARVLGVRYGFQYVAVPAEEFGETIGALCGTAEKTGIPFTEEAFTDSLLFFARMSDGDIQKCLGDMKRARVPRPSLMAMLTDTNKDWTVLALYEQLAREREAFRSKMAQYKADGHHHDHDGRRK